MNAGLLFSVVNLILKHVHTSQNISNFFVRKSILRDLKTFLAIEMSLNKVKHRMENHRARGVTLCKVKGQYTENRTAAISHISSMLVMLEC